MSGLVRFKTLRDANSPELPTLTPVLLGAKSPFAFEQDWVYSVNPGDISPYGGLALGGRSKRKIIRKVKDLIIGLGIEDAHVGEDVLFNLGTDKLGAEIVRAAFTSVKIGDRQFDWAIGGEPRQAIDLTKKSGSKVVTFLTGGCLGGSQSTIARTLSGKTFQLVESGSSANLTEELVSVEFLEGISLYEVDMAWRLVSTIAELARIMPGWERRVWLDIPRVQYYLYVLDAAWQGRIEPDVCLHWFDQVDARHQLNVTYFRKVLRRMGVDAEVSVRNEFDAVGVFLREQFRKGRAPTLVELVEVMAAEGDHLRQAALSSQYRERAGLGPLDSVKALNGVMYALNIAWAAQEGLAIEVDDPNELPIINAARKLVRDLGLEFPAFAVYPQSRFFPRTDGVVDSMFDTFTLYRDEPGRRARVYDPSGLTQFPNGQQVDLIELVPGLYAPNLV